MFIPLNFALPLPSLSLRTTVTPRTNWKECLRKILGGVGVGVNEVNYGLCENGG